jgi:hypothetical protein
MTTGIGRMQRASQPKPAQTMGAAPTKWSLVPSDLSLVVLPIQDTTLF